MPLITVGIPVYNGAKTLRAVLDCLRAQSFEDFEVIVSDNGSTDGSQKMVAEVARLDSRFRLLVQSENIGAKNNFLELARIAQSEFFVWRADDDLCDRDFLATLLSRFDSSPQLALVAPKVIFVHGDGSRNYEEAFEFPLTGTRSTRIGRSLIGASPSWIFGLWRRSDLLSALDATVPTYPYVWGWDPLALFPVLIEERVASDTSATLIKHTVSTARYRWRVPAREMWEMRRAFRRTCFRIFNTRNWTIFEKIALTIYVLRFANLRVYRFWKTVRAHVRQLRDVPQS